MKTAIAVILCLLSGSAIAAEHQQGTCKPLEESKAKAEKQGTWTLQPDSVVNLARGIYLMDPSTPRGLPYGDKVALVVRPGNEGGALVFIDGDMACTPIVIPKELIDLLSDVAAGKINHQGDPL